MKKRKLLTVVGITCLILVLASLLLPACAKEEAPAAPAAPAPVEVFNWRFQHCVGTENVVFLSDKNWTVELEKATGGRIKTTMYPDGAIVAVTEYLDALRDNTIQLSDFDGCTYKEFVPEGALSTGFPMLFRNANEMYKVFFEEGWADLLTEAFAVHGVHTVWPYSYGQVSIWATRPVRTLADFQGLKIRAIGETSVMLEHMGAAPTYIPHGESYMALQLGTIDAYSTAVVMYTAVKHYEIAPYIMRPGILLGMGALGASQKAIDELPEDLRLILEGMMPLRNFHNTWTSEEAESLILGNLADLGAEAVQMDQEVVDMMAAEGLKFLDEYREKSPGSAKMVDNLKAYLATKGR